MSDMSDSYSKSDSFKYDYYSFCEQKNEDSNTFFQNQREDFKSSQEIINPKNFSDNGEEKFFTNNESSNNNTINKAFEITNKLTNDKTENNKTQICHRKKRRKKGEGKTGGKVHNKYKIDNCKLKCVNLVLKYARQLLNDKIVEKKIKTKFKDRYARKILVNKKNEKSISSKNYYKKLLQKTIGEILRQDISAKYKHCSNEHNKELIEEILNHEDEEIRELFNDLLNEKFINYIKQFKEYENYSYLYDLTKFDEIKSDFSDEKYVKALNRGFESLLKLYNE